MRKINFIVGNPIKHSSSPNLHCFFYNKIGVELIMVPRVYINSVNLIEDIRNYDIGLTAVTMPLKSIVVQYIDRMSIESEESLSVNTIVYQSRILYGVNTDIDGIIYTLLDIDLRNKNILIIGSGSIAKIIGFYLSRYTKHMYWANRTILNSQFMSVNYGGVVFKYKLLLESHIDIIINTTPIGMLKFPGMPTSSNISQYRILLFDVIYNPLRTKFLLSTYKNKKSQCMSGLNMFIVQAIKQIEYLVGKKILSKKIIQYAKDFVINLI